MGGVVPDGFELVPCPRCGGGDFVVAHTGRDWILDSPAPLQVVRCTACDLHFTNPRPTLDNLGRLLEGYGATAMDLVLALEGRATSLAGALKGPPAARA